MPLWDVARAAELWGTMSPVKIADELGIAVQSVYRYCGTHRDKFPKQQTFYHEGQAGFTAEEDEQVRNLRAQGESYEKIGQQLGRSKNSVIGRARRLGLATPKSSRRTSSDTSRPRAVPTRPKQRPLALVAPKPIEPMQVRALSPIPCASKGDGCRMPLWPDDGPPTHKYCGAQTAWLRCSWCWSCLQRVATPEAYQRITHRLIAA